MDNVSAPFSSSSNENPMHQNFNPYSQINQNFSSTPYFLQYAERTQIPHRDTFLQVNDPFYSYHVSSFPSYGMVPTWESTEIQRKKKGAMMMSKIARSIRKEARQRTRSSSSTSRVSSSSTLELQASKKVASSRRSMEDKIVHNIEIHSRIPHTLHSLDGKRLKKLLTKTLKTSDVGFLGRIFLPKNEAEKNLPALSSKEGIEVVLKDVCTDHQWRMRYNGEKYWCNDKSRMYVLENTGNFVKHYQLQIGDSITIFEDEELKNLYVLPKKEQTPEVTQQFLPVKEEENHYDNNSNNDNYIIDMNMMPPYKQEKDDDIEDEASLGKLIDEILQESSHNNNNKLSTMCCSNNVVVGGSSNGTLGQVAPKSSSSSSFQDGRDDFFEGLDMPHYWV